MNDRQSLFHVNDLNYSMRDKRLVCIERKYYQEKSSDLNIANIVLTDNRFPLVYVMI